MQFTASKARKEYVMVSIFIPRIIGSIRHRRLTVIKVNKNIVILLFFVIFILLIIYNALIYFCKVGLATFIP